MAAGGRAAAWIGTGREFQASGPSLRCLGTARCFTRLAPPSLWSPSFLGTLARSRKGAGKAGSRPRRREGYDRMCARQAPPPDQIRTRGPGRGLEVSAQREWLSDPLNQTRSLGRYTRLQAGAGRGRAQQLPPPHDPPSSVPVPLSARPLPWEVCAGQGGRDYGQDDRSEPGLYSSLDPSSLHSAHPRCSPWDSGGEDGLSRAVASCPFPTLTCLLALSIPGWGHQS